MQKKSNFLMNQDCCVKTFVHRFSLCVPVTLSLILIILIILASFSTAFLPVHLQNVDTAKPASDATTTKASNAVSDS